MSVKVLPICFFLLLIVNTSSAQQNISELENYDCTYSKEVVIPFDYSKTSARIKNPPLNQIVFYSHRDQFTFWYKLIIKESCSVGFKVDPIDVRDNFTVFVYRYNKNDFCEKVYQNRIDHVKPLFFSNKAGKENPFSLNEKTFFAEAGNMYYISILNVSLNNCGHSIKLYNTSGKDTARIRAVHVPCVRDVAIASSIIDLNAMFNTDTARTVLTPVPKNIRESLNIKCEVSGDKKGKMTNPRLKITNELTGEEIKLKPVKNESFIFNIEKGKNYKVECSAIGYKFYDHSVRISDQTGSDNTFRIKLTPLKIGDNFVMKNIYFHPNTYVLRKESEVDLARLLSYLKANENVKIEIQGHTNSNNRIYRISAYSGMGEGWNFSGRAKKLSKKRAERIKKYLLDNSIEKKRLTAKGYGGDRMIIPHPQTIEEGQKNIRVEIVILEN